VDEIEAREEYDRDRRELAAETACACGDGERAPGRRKRTDDEPQEGTQDVTVQPEPVGVGPGGGLVSSEAR